MNSADLCYRFTCCHSGLLPLPLVATSRLVMVLVFCSCDHDNDPTIGIQSVRLFVHRLVHRPFVSMIGPVLRGVFCGPQRLYADFVVFDSANAAIFNGRP